jgi:hypothetical protein
MCDEQSVGIGDLVPDATVLYRACSRSNFLTPAKDAVQEIAFQKDGKNHKDGLSLALSVDESVRYLQKNHGVIRITVGEIHRLGRGLEVRFDTSDPLHVLIRNLPCMDRTSEEKALALAVSAELAAKAQIEYSKSMPKPAQPAPAP